MKCKTNGLRIIKLVDFLPLVCILWEAAWCKIDDLRLSTLGALLTCFDDKINLKLNFYIQRFTCFWCIFLKCSEIKHFIHNYNVKGRMVIFISDYDEVWIKEVEHVSALVAWYWRTFHLLDVVLMNNAWGYWSGHLSILRQMDGVSP